MSPSTKMCKIERGRHVFLRLPYVTSTVPGAVNADLSHNPILGLTCERLEMCFFLKEREREREGRRMGEISGVSLLRERTVPPLQSDIHMGRYLSLPARTTTFSTPSLPPIPLTSFFLSHTQHSTAISLLLPSSSRHARGPPCFKSPFELSSRV